MYGDTTLLDFDQFLAALFCKFQEGVCMLNI